MADASRFLAQSQSRLTFAPAPADDRQSARRPNQTWRSTTASRTLNPRAANPYQPTSSQISGFPFASRLNPQQAPLFYSATDEFREENDEEEHEREIADYYALQRSRRQLGASDLRASSEVDGGSGSSLNGASSHGDESRDRGPGRPGGIRSSWHGGAPNPRRKGTDLENLEESTESQLDNLSPESERNLMVDVGLEDTLRSGFDDDPPEDLMENPPSVQQLRKQPPKADHDYDSDESDQTSNQRRLLGYSQHHPGDQESVPDGIPPPQIQQPRHDAFFGQLYCLSLAAMCATWFLVMLHTQSPGTNQPLGDTVYTTLHGSFYLLATYTLVATFISLFWLAALRSYVRYLVYSILVAVPVILYSFSLYPLVSSFKGSWHGSSIQDTVMRWSSLVPAVLATLWLLAVFRGRLVMQKAISILEFATRILAANPTLVLVGFAVLGFIISFTWVWLSMFTRVFLGGHPSTRSAISKFVIDTSTWWLGVYFILVYLWTIAIAFGMQRTITSATVSQWYFHRLAVPAPTPQAIVKAALQHSATTLFGTIALFTGLSLMVRLPLIVLPRRMTMLIGVAMYSLIPSPVAVLINPLTLTYAAIHSQPLAVSSRGLSQMHFLAPNDATTALYPNTFNRRVRNDGWSNDSTPLLPYRLAKLILHATRFMMCLALGFGGWVTTARTLRLDGAGVRGSLYAYIVGLVAGAIGWGILGAMEGVLACIVDAVVVCWGSEVGSTGTGEVRYCREAGNLFRDDDYAGGRVSLA
ncbi:ctl transporter [Cladophialophora carrionii]|uniref:Protein PNS1 n=1 Tax=Cladophialophora carrionii TaxID=86049 RepID=A0A1C1CVW5_9EURO|nr:ctl transporter [Cladophialophora carrionii]